VTRRVTMCGQPRAVTVVAQVYAGQSDEAVAKAKATVAALKAKAQESLYRVRSMSSSEYAANGGGGVGFGVRSGDGGPKAKAGQVAPWSLPKEAATDGPDHQNYSHHHDNDDRHKGQRSTWGANRVHPISHPSGGGSSSGSGSGSGSHSSGGGGQGGNGGGGFDLAGVAALQVANVARPRRRRPALTVEELEQLVRTDRRKGSVRSD